MHNAPGRSFPHALLLSLPVMVQAFLAMLVLSLLGPALQVYFKLPPGNVTDLLMRLVVLLPVELVLMPRLLLCLDAQTWNSPSNPADGWSATFEDRWLRVVGAKLLLGLGLATGMSLFIVPGLVVLFLFGWMPMRVLLRGESLGQAGLESAALMRRAWPRAIPAAAALFGVYLLLMLGAAVLLQAAHPQATPWDRLTRPWFWAVYAFSGGMEILLSLGLWALYRWLDPEALPK